MGKDPKPFDHLQDSQATHLHAEDKIIVPVVEEELSASTREVERGHVRVHKDVVEEVRNIDVPVMEEEVEITRRRVDRPVADGDHIFTNDTIEVPLRGEEVDVEKTTRVVEEIDIDKTATSRTAQVTDSVHREDVWIEDGESVGRQLEADRAADRDSHDPGRGR